MPASPLYHQELGQHDQAVLLLHGLGSAAADWQLQVPVFARHYRVLTLDLPGHGRSPAPPGRLTVEGMAEQVAVFLAQRAEPALPVVGLSLGGCVALALALRHPEQVRSLVLVNSFARLRPAGWRGALRLATRLGLLVAAPMPTVAAYVARGLFPRPDQRPLYAEAAARLSRNPRRAYLAAMQAVARFNVLPRLGAIACPTLIIAGDRDQTVPPTAAHALHAAIPGAALRLLPDSGHATPYDQPAAFNEAVLQFLAAQPALAAAALAENTAR